MFCWALKVCWTVKHCPNFVLQIQKDARKITIRYSPYKPITMCCSPPVLFCICGIVIVLMPIKIRSDFPFWHRSKSESLPQALRPEYSVFIDSPVEQTCRQRFPMVLASWKEGNNISLLHFKTKYFERTSSPTRHFLPLKNHEIHKINKNIEEVEGCLVGDVAGVMLTHLARQVQHQNTATTRLYLTKLTHLKIL